MKDFAILVLSCDRYSSLWDNFFIQFNKHFKNKENVKLYFGSNELDVYQNGFINLNSVIFLFKNSAHFLWPVLLG